ncbi:MAG: ferritin-like domain-containing protein [Rhodospirillaceae bacterium]
MQPPINPVWPVVHLKSVNELMGIAVAMEAEAAARYDQLEAEMSRQDNRRMADLFGRLARLEREHCDGLAHWAERLGDAPPIKAVVPWEFPETFEADLDATRLTPYTALVVAVRNEERAFSLYAYLAAIAEDNAVRDRAEALAREELEHVALLRRMRREAFHADRPKRRSLPRDVASLGALARALDAEAAEADRRMADDVATIGSAVRSAEDAVDIYLEIADHASDPEMLSEAQVLAGRAVSRLTLLRSRSAELG